MLSQETQEVHDRGRVAVSPAVYVSRGSLRPQSRSCLGPNVSRLHEQEKQYTCAYCLDRFKNKGDAERHQNSLHTHRHSWSCAVLFELGIKAAWISSSSQTDNFDICGYCGKDYSSSTDWNTKTDHSRFYHKHGECNLKKKFFRADHFRQHLKHSHSGLSGRWTNVLENSCMVDEEPNVINEMSSKRVPSTPPMCEATVKGQETFSRAMRGAERLSNVHRSLLATPVLEYSSGSDAFTMRNGNVLEDCFEDSSTLTEYLSLIRMIRLWKIEADNLAVMLQKVDEGQSFGLDKAAIRSKLVRLGEINDVKLQELDDSMEFLQTKLLVPSKNFTDLNTAFCDLLENRISAPDTPIPAQGQLPRYQANGQSAARDSISISGLTGTRVRVNQWLLDTLQSDPESMEYHKSEL